MEEKAAQPTADRRLGELPRDHERPRLHLAGGGVELNKAVGADGMSSKYGIRSKEESETIFKACFLLGIIISLQTSIL